MTFDGDDCSDSDDLGDTVGNNSPAGLSGDSNF